MERGSDCRYICIWNANLHAPLALRIVMTRYIRRALEPTLAQVASEFPAVVVTGPRQSGKTTLLRRWAGGDYGYVSLELPDVRAVATEDPRSFLARHPPPVIFDEVQWAPEILFYVKERIDERRDEPGQFLLTGSQDLLLTAQVAESLAGRAAVLRLLPLSRREAAPGRLHAPFLWEAEEATGPGVAATPTELWREFVRGCYPELVANPRRDASLWHSSYVQTYLERDVRNLRRVGDLSQFQSFLRALAARSGQLLNASDLARDLGVVTNTIRAWLSVLEATHQIVYVRPYFANIGKRLVKSPKVYFTDTGILCHLTGLRDTEHAAAGPMAGAIMETAVLAEIRKTLANRGVDAPIYFWRTAGGVEVDFLVQVADQLVPVEVKKTATPRPAMARPIQALQKDLRDRVGHGYVVHSGDGRTPLGPEVTAAGFSEL